MKHLLALAMLVAGPSLAMAQADPPNQFPPAEQRAMTYNAAPTSQAAVYELRADIGTRGQAQVETQLLRSGNDPYASGVLTEPKDIQRSN